MLGSTSPDHERLDPAAALMREVGAQLRQVRLDRGEDLDDVARHLRIKSTYLFAIEQGDLAALPGRPYALGFLRSYADHLGFDGEDLVARIKSSVGGLTDRTRLRVRAPMPENRLPKMPMVVISLAVVAGIYLGWSYVNRTSRTVTEFVAEVPSDLREPAIDRLAEGAGDGAPAIEGLTSRSAAPDDAEGVTAAESPDAIASAQAPASPSDGSGGSSAVVASTADPEPRDTPAQPRSAEPATAASDEPGQDASEQMLSVQPAAGGEVVEPTTAATPSDRSAAEDAPAQSAAGAPPASAVARAETSAEVGAARTEEVGDVSAARQAVALLLDPAAREAAGVLQVYETVNTDARVILRAREPSWIQVSSRGGDYTFTRTLEPGEALLVPNRPDLELWTGNAGGLEIMVDGTPVSLGPGRAVRRNVSLDPDRLSESSDQPR